MNLLDEETQNYTPASRFINTQSWWIASELVRRNPQLFIHEMHPGGGMYDCLALLVPSESGRIQLNRAGSIQIPPEWSFRIEWTEVLAAESAHAVVKRIEGAVQLGTRGPAPASTPRVITYRFLAAVLGLTLNSRHAWDVRNEFLDSSGDEEQYLNGYLDNFPAAREALQDTPRVGLWQEPHSHFWAILRGSEPVALASIEGMLYLPERSFNLLEEYDGAGRDLLQVITKTLGKILKT